VETAPATILELLNSCFSPLSSRLDLFGHIRQDHREARPGTVIIRRNPGLRKECFARAPAAAGLKHGLHQTHDLLGLKKSRERWNVLFNRISFRRIRHESQKTASGGVRHSDLPLRFFAIPASSSRHAFRTAKPGKASRRNFSDAPVWIRGILRIGVPVKPRC
jgi:hypothetical protein